MTDVTFGASDVWSTNEEIKIHKTTVLPVVLYACETWLLKLRGEWRLRIFENMILRRICVPKNGEWIRLHNEELHSLYRSHNIVRVIKSGGFRWACHVARTAEVKIAFEMLTGKPTG